MRLNDDDRRAITALCGQSMVLRDLLDGFPNLDDFDDIRCDRKSPLDERVIAFADKLKSYLHTMARELEELGPGAHADRLRSEAVGIGVALRNLAAYCPDPFETVAEPPASLGR